MWPNHEYWWSAKQPQVTDLRWQLGFQWHRRGIELVSSHLTVSQSDCFTLRPFFAATYVFVVWKILQADYKVADFFKFFLPQFGGGALSSNIFTICAIYWSLGCRGYFGVSNVVLVENMLEMFLSYKWRILLVHCRSTVDPTDRQRPHTLRSREYCWCDKDTMAQCSTAVSH